MELNEPSALTATPRSSRLAKASLTLGICALISFIIGLLLPSINGSNESGVFFLIAFACGLLASILGVLGLIRIRKSHGLLFGKGRAMAGCNLGTLCLLLMMFVALVPPSRHPEIARTQGEVVAHAVAVQCYQTEYGHFPGQNATNSDHHYSGAEGRLLLETLRGSNLVWNGKPSNPKKICFLSVDEHGIVTTNAFGTAQVGEFADFWGNRYEVVADWNGDGKLDAPLADGEAVQNHGVAVWSYGPKGKAIANPADETHIRSWR